MKKRKRGKKKKKKKKEKGNDKRGISDKYSPIFPQNQGIYEYLDIPLTILIKRNTDNFLPGGLGAVLALRASYDANRPVTQRVGREAAVVAASIASAALPASSTAAMPASSSASSLAT